MKIKVIVKVRVVAKGKGIRMELNEKKAYEDFESIKVTLDQAKKGYNGLYEILWTYGVIQLILCVLSILMGSLLKNLVAYSFISLLLNTLATIYIMIFYFRLYNAENTTSNKYYLSCISMWGVITIVLPFINIAVRVTILAAAPDQAIILLPKIQEYNMIINILLVCFCFIICGFICNEKVLIILSIIILFVFLELSILYYNTNISEHGTTMLTVFYYICVTLGYIGLSYLLRWRNKNGYK